MALSSNMPELASFEILLAIAETGSLGGAARELGMTQQGVSRRLASMEAQTGVALAVRTTRGSDLTPAGIMVADWAARLLEVARDIDAGLGSLREGARQRIRVVASQTIAEHLMPHWLLSLRAPNRNGDTAPQVIPTATTSEQAIASVRNGTADLGFVEKPGPLEGLGSCVVGHDELVVVVAPSHKWALRSPVISALELAQTPLVCREPHSGIRDSLTVALLQVLGDNVQQPPPVLELSSAAAVRAAVLAGAGPAAMSRLAVGDDLAVGRLRAIAVPELDLGRQLRAIWVGGRTPPAGAIRTLLRHISSLRWAEPASAVELTRGRA
ncbi:LysR family transcriptional regulator [Mycobacterium sp. ML4]